MCSRDVVMWLLYPHLALVNRLTEHQHITLPGSLEESK